MLRIAVCTLAGLAFMRHKEARCRQMAPGHAGPMPADARRRLHLDR